MAIEAELKKAAPDWRVIEAASRGIVDADPDSVRFSVDAAHIQRLGEQLVSKQETALSELIKNAFDADAMKVELTFTDQGHVGGTLLIADDGVGMTEDVIRSSWMRISTDTKAKQPFSTLFRRVRAGRKGIGRFAVQRLGKELIFTTKPVGLSEGYRVHFSWDAQFNAGTSLHDVFSRIERFNKFPSEHGTELRITSLRDAWTTSAIEKVWRAVILLQPPFPTFASANSEPDAAKRGIVVAGKGDERPSDPGFSVVINGTTRQGQTALFSIKQSFLSQAVARITASIDEDGIAKVTVASDKLDLLDSVMSDVSFDLTGPVLLDSHYFIYEPGLLSGLMQSAASQMGRDYGGIRIYRNGFRVQPYGEPSDDWLKLAFDTGRRSLLVPANNHHFFGQVSLTDQDNPLIEETSSREGLVENEAFTQLRVFARWALETAALRVASIRKRKQTAGERNFISVKRRPSEVLRDIIERRIGRNLEGDGEDQTDGGGVDGDVDDDFATVVKVVTDYEREVEAQRAASIEYEEMLRILASLGLSISVFGHEVKGAEGALAANILLLGELIAEVDDVTLRETLTEQHQDLERAGTRMFDIGGYIAGLMSKTESRELRDLSVKGAIDRFVQQFSNYMAKQKVHFEVDVVPAEMRTTAMHGTELDSVLLNFLTNAIKSMKRAKVSDRRVRIEARLDGDRVVIAFEDNGEGIPADMRDRVFEPFFTTTLNADDDGVAGPGTGLGLKIVSDIARSYGGEARVGEPSEDYECRMEFSLLAAKGSEHDHG